MWSQPSFFVFDTDEEEESFGFFRSYSVSEFTALFPQDSDFWCSSVLAVSMLQPAIRYAVSALGSLHRHYVDGYAPLLPADAVNHKLGRFGLSQYTKALKSFAELAVSGAAVDQLFATIACVIIIHISSIQGFQTTSLRHLANALKLFQELQAKAHSLRGSPYDIQIRALRTILMSLQSQARSLNCNQVDITNVKFSDKPDTVRVLRDTPVHFATPDDARDCYTLLMDDMQALAPDYGTACRIGPAEDSIKLLFDRLLAAEEALQRLQMQSLESDAQNTVPCQILQLDFSSTDLYLRVFPMFGTNGEMAWDNFDGHFAKMVNLCRQILADGTTEQLETADPSPTATDSSKSSKPILIAFQGVIGPLFEVAAHCRVPHIRYEALRLLETYPRREGLWDSLSTAIVAREMINLEETLYADHRRQQQQRNATAPLAQPSPPHPSYTGAVIPRDCRIIDVDVVYANPHTLSLRFQTEKQWHNLGKKSIFAT